MPPSIGWTTRCVRLSRRRAVAAGILLFVVACVTHPPRPAPPPPPVDTTPAPVRPDTMRPEPIEQAPPPSENALQGGTIVRIALSAGAPHVTVSGSGEWRLYDSGGESALLRANAGDLWTIESRDGALRAVHDDGSASPWRPAPFVARPVTRGALLSVNGRRYRGEIWVRPVTGGVMVINRLYLEDYLRGVVPLEIGKRAPGEEAAVAAQAVAARSYAYTHLLNSPTRPYDMLATVMDQVYGGADAEFLRLRSAGARPRRHRVDRSRPAWPRSAEVQADHVASLACVASPARGAPLVTAGSPGGRCRRRCRRRRRSGSRRRAGRRSRP